MKNMSDGKLVYVPVSEIDRMRRTLPDPVTRTAILADLFRINALSMIMEAGSGHIGSSLSAMDIVAWLWTEEMRNPNDDSKEYSDIYFSSKGHDAPGLYAVMIGMGLLPESLLHRLRKIDGLPGHPDILTPYIPTNTGPLGMGLAKARGMAGARRLSGKKGRIFVLLGDGELQEGQNWESLQPIANDGYAEITAIVDNNKMQSDTYVDRVSNLGDLEAKFKAFGWEVFRIDGHDSLQIRDAIQKTKHVIGKPQVIIADTKKGKGVSFMEEVGEDGYYKFHSGAPSREMYEHAVEEIIGRVRGALHLHALPEIRFDRNTDMPVRIPLEAPEKLVTAYGDELVSLARTRKDIVTMDADLVLDTGLIPFSKEFPDRYVEAGIAEQYMVSMAGGYALKGMLPVVHSFECFLSTHANAQIYNNASEKTKIIYAGSLAGLIPAAPGHSHQSLRGISLLGSVPGLTMIEPSNEREARMAIRHAVEENKESTYIRLMSIPIALPYSLPETYALEKGKGVFLREGSGIAVIAYGPVLLKEAVQASDALKKEGKSVAVINMPWLNSFDEAWVRETLGAFRAVVTLDDHYVSLGQGVQIAALIAKLGMSVNVTSLGITEIPQCGTTSEVLAYHKLDAEHLAEALRSV
jgi:transketolase